MTRYLTETARAFLALTIVALLYAAAACWVAW